MNDPFMMITWGVGGWKGKRKQRKKEKEKTSFLNSPLSRAPPFPILVLIPVFSLASQERRCRVKEKDQHNPNGAQQTAATSENCPYYPEHVHLPASPHPQSSRRPGRCCCSSGRAGPSSLQEDCLPGATRSGSRRRAVRSGGTQPWTTGRPCRSAANTAEVRASSRLRAIVVVDDGSDDDDHRRPARWSSPWSSASACWRDGGTSW